MIFLFGDTSDKTSACGDSLILEQHYFKQLNQIFCNDFHFCDVMKNFFKVIESDF